MYVILPQICQFPEGMVSDFSLRFINGAPVVCYLLIYIVGLLEK